MDPGIPVADWADYLGREYLGAYLAAGGSAVKVAVCPDGSADPLSRALAARAADARCGFAAVSAADLRVHMPQDLYFGVAAQIDWRRLARESVLRFADREALKTDGLSSDGSDDLVGAIAEANGLDRDEVFRQVRSQVSQSIFRRRAFTRNFRVAMSQLCAVEMKPPAASYAGKPIVDWLVGAERRAAPVRPFGVYGVIDRTTARGMLESTLRWLSDSGRPGLVFVIDNRRVLLSQNPRDGGRYYTRPMVLDHYEVLRELIDDIDRLPGLLVVVVTGPEFTEARRRGYRDYEGLYFRLVNDVRDESVQNMAGALVRLA